MPQSKKRYSCSFLFWKFYNLHFFLLKENFACIFITVHRLLCQEKILDKKILIKFEFTFLPKSFESLWLQFFHKLSLWNCMTRIFGLWRSIRKNFNKIDISLPKELLDLEIMNGVPFVSKSTQLIVAEYKTVTKVLLSHFSAHL